MLKNKKGIALSEAFTAVLTLALVAILVIIGIVLFVNLNTAFTGTSAVTVINESITPTDAGVATAGASNCSAGSFVATAANNVSDTINSANYTLGSSTGILTNLTSEFSGAWQLSYTYTWGSEACTASQGMITQFATYPALIGLVGTIIFLGIVIGVLVASFVFGGKEGV